MKKRIFSIIVVISMIMSLTCIFPSVANASGTVTFQGDLTYSFNESGTKTTLPTAPDGYYYMFFANGKPWDGTNITGNITVTVIKCAIPYHTVLYQGDYIGEEEVREDKQALMNLPKPADGYYYSFTAGGEVWDGTNIKTDVTVNVEIKKFPFEAGDYVTLGMDGEKRLKWRCVSFEKITGYNYNLEPTVDPTDTRTTYVDGYLPLLVTDMLLDSERPYNIYKNQGGPYHDGEEIGHYRIPIYEQVSYWDEYGCSIWSKASLRDWLNSFMETGFLNGFSEADKKLIKTVERKTIVDDYYRRMDCFKNCNTIEEYAGYYSGLTKEKTSDKVFLLDIMQVNSIKQNSEILGDDYYIAKADNIVINSDNSISHNYTTENCIQMIGTPGPSYNSQYEYGIDLLKLDETGNISRFRPNAKYGIRPAIYLNPSYVDSLTKGSGSEGKPYEIDDDSTLEIEEPIASTIILGDKLENSTLSGGRVIKNGKEIKGSFEWEDKDYACIRLGAHYESAIFKPNDLNECSPFVTNIILNVKMKFPEFSFSDIQIGTKLSSVRINVDSYCGNFSWVNPDQEIVSGKNVCQMKFSSGNYSRTKNYIEYKDYIFSNSVLPNSILPTTANNVELGDDYSVDLSITTNVSLKKINFDVKYPTDTELVSLSNKEFTKLTINSTIVEDGYNSSNITAEYIDGAYVEPNIEYDIMTLNFKAKENATLGKKQITFSNVSFFNATSTETKLTDSKAVTPTYIKKPVSSITINGATEVYDTSLYSCSVFPSNATDKTFFWTVSNESVATISEDGVLTALKNGTITLFAIANDGSGKYGSLTVNVHVLPKINYLSTNIGDWNSEFNNSSKEYVIYVDEASESIILNAVFSGGTLKINNEKSVTSGKAVSYSLAAKTTVLTLRRVGTDGTTNEYILKIIKGDGCAFDAQYINEETSYAFDVQIRDEVEFDNAVIVIAGYDENGKFSKLNYKNVTSKDREYAVDFESKTKLASFKVMLWDSLQNMNPISRAKTLTESTKKQSAQLEISEILESSHNYGNNLDETKTYTYSEDCDSIDITFNSSTKVENGYDYIYIYDASDNQIGKYTGTILAGQTIKVPGNTVKIRLTSDSGISYYGYKTDKIVVNLN